MDTLHDLVQSLRRMGIKLSDVHISGKRNPDDVEDSDEDQIEEE